MAIVDYFKKYELSVLRTAGIKYKGLQWCELGNQKYGKDPAKKLYQQLGVKHTSIDLNGRDGSLRMDLGTPITTLGEFDIVTNYGTTEHVNNQYEVFENIHRFCKINGLMIHGVPLINNWPGHCRYYYTMDFFKQLGILCNYRIIDLAIFNSEFYTYPRNLVVAVFQKTETNKFPAKLIFNSLKIQDSKNLKKTQDYT